jgi:hypothetical protein
MLAFPFVECGMRIIGENGAEPARAGPAGMRRRAANRPALRFGVQSAIPNAELAFSIGASP